MRAHDNNCGETVVELFMEAVDRHGAPSRVRGDRGSENVMTAVWMIIHRGPNRGSYLWGMYVLI